MIAHDRLPPLRWLAAVGLLLFACNAHAALRLQANTAALSPQQVLATRQLLHEVVQRLPPSMIESLDREIIVQWRDDLPARVHGRAHATGMSLDRALLDAWILRSPSAGHAGKSDPATRAALAAVIHELAHFHDRTRAGNLSGDPRLLDIAGFQVSPMRLGLRNPRNAFSDRSPDAYELTRPAEFVAVNLEHFLLDPAYACRRPALHRHLAAHFNWAPLQDSCAPGLVYLRAGADSVDAPLLELDPARVYAVDYLLAEGNEQVMSRWGHSMLRLVICAPTRVPGPDCRLDLQHHQVLSFRAFVDDLQLSSWRGLTGSYPSRLFVLPLQQVIDEYTKVELRGLQSIPLRLEPAEVEGLLERAAQLHWSYDGRYYFVSNNCAVETFKLLHDGVPRLAGEPLASITPTGLLRRLQRRDIADVSVLDNAPEALRIGYRFDSMSERYQGMFDVARAALSLPQVRLQDWLELPPTQRAVWTPHADLRTSAALLVLEQAAMRRQELLARDELKRRFLGTAVATHDVAPGTTMEAMQEFLRLEGMMSRPALLVPGSGYGLPQAHERTLLAAASATQASMWSTQRQALRAQARRLLSVSRRDALEGTEANVDRIGARLRLLHRKEDGLQLN